MRVFPQTHPRQALPATMPRRFTGGPTPEINYYDRLVRYNGVQNFSGGFAWKVSKELEALPKAVLQILDKDGWRIILGRHLSDVFPGQSYQSLRGHKKGTRLDNVSAVCLSPLKTIGIAEFVHLRDTTYYKAEDVGVGVRHEIGHALNQALKNRVHLPMTNAQNQKPFKQLLKTLRLFQPMISESPDFIDAYMKDYSNWSETQKTRLYYLIQANDKGQPSKGGMDEAFADVFADMFGGGCLPKAIIDECFPNTQAFVKSLMLQINAL